MYLQVRGVRPRHHLKRTLFTPFSYCDRQMMHQRNCLELSGIAATPRDVQVAHNRSGMILGSSTGCSCGRMKLGTQIFSPLVHLQQSALHQFSASGPQWPAKAHPIIVKDHVAPILREKQSRQSWPMGVTATLAMGAGN